MKNLANELRHVDRRDERRVPLRLNVAVVYHQHADAATRPTYHGVTKDISMLGISLVVNFNIFNDGEVTLLLAIPPAHMGGTQTVYSAEHEAFRIGLSFKAFKRNGKALLEAELARHPLYSAC